MATIARFVIHKHAARHLHYDFRLEMDGTLKSWAIPKEPPTQLGIKRLAVQVDDHPLSYIDFEGTIPEGEYGAGTVQIWDKGTYTPKSLRSNKLVFTLTGDKLRGDYTLLRFKEDKNWLIFKNKPKQLENSQNLEQAAEERLRPRYQAQNGLDRTSARQQQNSTAHSARAEDIYEAAE